MRWGTFEGEGTGRQMVGSLEHQDAGLLAFALVGGGWGHFDHTNCLFGNSGKTAARSATVFAYLLMHQFDTLLEDFSPMSSQVRSPGQVK